MGVEVLEGEDSLEAEVQVIIEEVIEEDIIEGAITVAPIMEVDTMVVAIVDP